MYFRWRVDPKLRVCEMEKLAKACALLAEALDHITDKPWDDRTQLHSRICKFLGRSVTYPDFISDKDDSEIAG